MAISLVQNHEKPVEFSIYKDGTYVGRVVARKSDITVDVHPDSATPSHWSGPSGLMDFTKQIASLVTE